MDSCEKEFVDMYKKIGRLSGIDDLSATIFGMLYIAPEDVSMDELSKKTGYSLASISNKIKMLEIHGFITRKNKPGTRKTYLYVEKELVEPFKKMVVTKQENQLKLIRERMPDIINKCKKKAKSAEEKAKLKIMENYLEQALKLDKILGKMIELFNTV